MPQSSVRPSPDEYNEFYSGYVNSVPDGDLTAFLSEQQRDLISLRRSLDDTAVERRYAPDKWSVRQVLGHLVDTEWIFAYRMMRIARGDATPLPGMDQDEFMEGANFSERLFESMIEEFEGLRTATIRLSGSFSDEILNRRGTASGFEVSVRALRWIIAGHCQHHMKVLNERYL